MLAVYAAEPHPDAPFDGLQVGDRPEPEVADGWARVQVRAASLNRHDLWTLRGVGIKPDQFPMILGCDGAGVTDDGRSVVLYPIIGTPGSSGDETTDPGRTLLTEQYQGTFAEYVAVPARNLRAAAGVDDRSRRPPTLGTTYLTAYRMLVTRSGLPAGSTILVQGATRRGVHRADPAGPGAGHAGLGDLPIRAGPRPGRWTSARTRSSSSGARLPERVDGVFESVGRSTWSHSMRAVRPGGVIVCCGATSGADPSADLQRLFFLQISVIGSTMGTLDEFRRLIAFCAATGLRPVVDRTFPLAQGREALELLENGTPGKLVLTTR